MIHNVNKFLDKSDEEEKKNFRPVYWIHYRKKWNHFFVFLLQIPPASSFIPNRTAMLIWVAVFFSDSYKVTEVPQI